MQRPRNPTGDQRSDGEETVQGCFCETSCHLTQEMQETKSQLQRQKSLKEIDNTKRKKKKLLQVDYEELRVAHVISEEKFTSEFQAEKNKNKLLQEELERLCISYQVLNARYENENDVPKIREQADALQRDFETRPCRRITCSLTLMKLPLHSRRREKNKTLQDQMDRMSVSHEVNLSYQADVIDVRQQADTLRPDLKRELEQTKLLQTTYKVLQEAHKLSQEKFSAELDAEKEKNKILQQEMDKICV
ncbi:hypothetical protein GBF38_007395 [Nibea albiflora]|uniref:Uncharacterized protein n=1 Tax=Nibea albiflora TaxID=240163 RepID=A0ACB7EHY9_NIBAL|nr:hypothetical protein GBF38_007395 [Nibea albiflora]